jgi:CheY-like chemotaxis protein
MNKKIIFLADDDSDDTEMFSEALLGIESDITFHCADNGREALQKLNELTALPHLIFLDINMPVMNGWQCLKVLKAEDRYKHIPVVMISTSTHPQDTTFAADLGAISYFTKPNNFKELTFVLEKLIALLDEN